jgi:hypothetical protein
MTGKWGNRFILIYINRSSKNTLKKTIIAVYILFSPYLSFYHFCFLIINTVYSKVVFIYISFIFAKCLSFMIFLFVFTFLKR